jgi:CxxC-x17-CxxC domain-containing protein
MSFVDRELVCLDCAQAFVFTGGEQEFYERKGFKEEPKRCKPCRDTRKQRRNDTPVTTRAPRAAAATNGANGGGNGLAHPAANGAANGNGFGFRGDEDDDAQPGPGNRAYTDVDDDDSIGNRAPGVAPARTQRPQAAAPRGANGGGARRERSAPGGAGNGGGGGERRDLHDATCAQCNGVARVPFKPVPGRPVYCRDCYASRAASAGGR